MSFLIQGSGQWAKPGVPCIAFHDEQPESPTSAYGRYDNALNGDTGRYHIVYVDGMTYNLEYVSDSGPFSSVNLLWTDRAPFQFEQPGWGMMYLIP